jgi:enediyne biosynthesis protein E4
MPERREECKSTARGKQRVFSVRQRLPQRRMPTANLAYSLGVLCSLLLFILLGCRNVDRGAFDEPAEPSFFQEVTAECRLAFQHEAGPLNHFMPQAIGSGAALLDYDQDGRLDIYLLHNAGPRSTATNRLFHQEADGSFRDVSAGSGLDIAGWGMGVAVGDLNNDGWPDVLVTQYGGSRLFVNNGNGTFTDITREAGLDVTLWGTSAAFVDFDRDGLLDLVLVHYVDYGPDRPCTDLGGKPEYCPPNVFPGTVTKLFHNRSGKDHRIRFDDVTVSAGLGKRPGPGLGVVCADFNGDRWPDLLVANDRQANYLWINQKDGTFKEQGVFRGLAYNADGVAQANMGVALGDVDGDGRFDIFISHLTEETHTLWKQQTLGFFTDQTVASGLADTRWRGTGFGTVMGDFANEGALDLVVVNGRVMHGQPPPGTSAEARARLGDFWSQYAERNQLFRNNGQGVFRDISRSNPALCGQPGVFRGLACGDLNNDGGLDLLVTSVAGPAQLFRNVVPQRGHWLLARVVDPKLHRDAYGAEVTVIAGGRRWKRWLNPGYSFLCSNDPRVHFGLGAAEQIEAIEVLWPDEATVQVFEGCAVDQVIELRKGSRQPVVLGRGKP